MEHHGTKNWSRMEDDFPFHLGDFWVNPVVNVKRVHVWIHSSIFRCFLFQPLNPASCQQRDGSARLYTLCVAKKRSLFTGFAFFLPPCLVVFYQ